MNGILDFLFVFLSFIISTIYAGKAMRNCINKGLYDKVNKRSSHKTPTPRGGGYSFVVVISIFSLSWLNLFSNVTNLEYLNTLFLSSIFIAFLGWLDDNYNISPKLRFICQILASSICIYILPSVLHGLIPLWAEKTLLVLAWVWFINLYNFMDGIDGIAATQSACMAFALSMIIPEIKPILLVILGSMVGFLRFNWHPAKVFMGDVGSTYLGFIIAGLLIYNLQFNIASNFWVGLILSAIFISDATYTLIKRLLKLKKPWQAHKEHFYQRAVMLGIPHSSVVKRVLALNILFILFALVAHITNLGIYLFFTSLIILIIVAIRIRYLEGK